MPANADWIWLDPDVIMALHDEQLAEHGGAAGVRDVGLLGSALARPRNLALDGEPDAAELAAAYAFGLVRNHPFGDGNKRSAFVATELFLELNGMRLAAADEPCVLMVLQLAASDVTEADFADWLRRNLKPH